MNRRRVMGVVLLFAALLLLLGAIYLYQLRIPVPLDAANDDEIGTIVELFDPLPPQEPEEEEETVEDYAALEDDGLPHDTLFITEERQAYQDADLQLIIPKLSVDVPVLNGTNSETLLRGVGLYEYAQLPGEGNRNVSIAGHRNGLRNGKITDSMPFYYIDTLAEGDCLYLRDSAYIYQYVWSSQEIVTPDNWGPIYSQGFSCLTLTTCTPIGVADHRLIVYARLVEIIDYDTTYDYPAQIEPEA